jgi:cytoskeletal protein RodZ
MKSIGLTLQQAREARGMSIEDVAQVTRISRAIIHAIENGDQAALPADVYVRGFTRTIAKTVGLDPQAVLLNHTATPLHTLTPVSQREEDRFEMLFGRGATHQPVLGAAHALMALVAVGLFLAAWLLVGHQPDPHATAQDLEGGVPVIQEHVDAVTPFTAQGLRADARR